MDPNNWLKQQVPGYAALSLAERRAIKDFSLLWSLFEGTHLNTSGSANAIAAHVAALQAANRLAARPQLQAALLHFRNRYFQNAAFNHAFNSLHFRNNDRRPFVESVLSGQVNDAASVLSALLIIIYRLRNNLFHGVKWAYGIANQLENFRHANRVLMVTMTL